MQHANDNDPLYQRVGDGALLLISASSTAPLGRNPQISRDAKWVKRSNCQRCSTAIAGVAMLRALGH